MTAKTVSPAKYHKNSFSGIQGILVIKAGIENILHQPCNPLNPNERTCFQPDHAPQGISEWDESGIGTDHTFKGRAQQEIGRVCGNKILHG